MSAGRWCSTRCPRRALLTSLALSLLTFTPSASTAETAPAYDLLFLGLRPTRDDSFGKTLSSAIPAAEEIQRMIQSALSSTPGRKVISLSQLPGSRGSDLSSAVRACEGDARCIATVLEPLKSSGVSRALIGEYYESFLDYQYRFRLFDIDQRTVTQELRFKLSQVLSKKVETWLESMSYVFAAPGRIRLLTDVTPAACTLNSQPCDMKGEIIPNLREGEYELFLSKPGHEDVRRKAKVSWGKETRVIVSLVPPSVAPTSRRPPPEERAPDVPPPIPADAASRRTPTGDEARRRPPPAPGETAPTVSPEPKAPPQAPVEEPEALEPASPAPTSAEQAKAGGDHDGKDKPYTIGFKFRAHIQHLYQANTPIVVNPVQESNQFFVRRLQLTVHGNVFSPRVTYHLRANWGVNPNRDDENAPGDLGRVWVNFKFLPELQLKVGLLDVHYDRERLSDTNEQQFVERSLVDDNFAVNIRTGLFLHGFIHNDLVAYEAFAMNGDFLNVGNRDVGDNQLRELAPIAFAVGARVHVSLLGAYSIEMSDLSDSKDVQLAVAVAGVYDPGAVPLRRSSLKVPVDVLRGTADVTLKYRGASFIGIVHTLRNLTTGWLDYGLVAQGGYFVIPGILEIAARAELVIPTQTRTAMGIFLVAPYKLTTGVNYFIDGQKLKLYANYEAFLRDFSFNGVEQNQFRTQLHLAF